MSQTFVHQEGWELQPHVEDMKARTDRTCDILAEAKFQAHKDMYHLRSMTGKSARDSCPPDSKRTETASASVGSRKGAGSGMREAVLSSQAQRAVVERSASEGRCPDWTRRRGRRSAWACYAFRTRYSVSLRWARLRAPHLQ